MMPRISEDQFAKITKPREKRTRKPDTRPLEKDVQAAVKSYLHRLGALPIRVNSGAMTAEHNERKRFIRFTSEPGCSDIIVCLDGYFIAVECKRVGEVATAAQLAFGKKVQDAGGVFLVVSSVDQLREGLKAVGL